MNEYICLDCGQEFTSQFSCPGCGSENYVPLYNEADKHLFIGGPTEIFSGDYRNEYQANQVTH